MAVSEPITLAAVSTDSVPSFWNSLCQRELMHDALMRQGRITGVLKLRKVVVLFERTREIPDALAYAQAAEIKLELELKCEGEIDRSWGPSFGLSDESTLWTVDIPIACSSWLYDYY